MRGKISRDARRLGPTALELVKQLKLRNEALALFLVDQRMPRMSGVGSWTRH